MKVSDLAAELGVPPSAVLEQCQRFDIDAAWAGAELSGSDVVVLRAELGRVDEPLDLTPADGDASRGDAASDVRADPPAEVPPAAPAEVPAAALPPTSAASLPDAVGGPEPVPVATERIPVRPGAGTGPAPEAGAATVSRPADHRPPERRLDRAVRSSVAALVVAAAALVGAELVSNPWMIWGLWLLAAVATAIALWKANAGRRHVLLHPERHSGLPLAVVTLVLSIGAALVIATSVYASVRTAPAEGAPLGARESVARARWGWERLDRIRHEGWKRPAKDAGTCWVVDSDVERDVERVEVGTRLVACGEQHTVQVVRVFAVDRDADARYPGADELQAVAVDRCGALVEGLLDAKGDRAAIDGVLLGEVPTAAGWNHADHDVACAVVTAPRKGALR